LFKQKSKTAMTPSKSHNMIWDSPLRHAEIGPAHNNGESRNTSRYDQVALARRGSIKTRSPTRATNFRIGQHFSANPRKLQRRQRDCLGHPGITDTVRRELCKLDRGEENGLNRRSPPRAAGSVGSLSH
jgi:hypothetical protein